MTISQNGEEKLRGGKEKEEEKKDKYTDGNNGKKQQLGRHSMGPTTTIQVKD